LPKVPYQGIVLLLYKRTGSSIDILFHHMPHLILPVILQLCYRVPPPILIFEPNTMLAYYVHIITSKPFFKYVFISTTYYYKLIFFILCKTLQYPFKFEIGF